MDNNNIMDNNINTIEEFSWRLLLDDINSEQLNGYCELMLSIDTVTNDNNSNKQLNACNNEKISDTFQVLITIYMEMIYGSLKINNLLNNCDLYDFSKVTINELSDSYKLRFSKINTVLNVFDVTNEIDSFQNYYCKIMLKDTPEGKIYFSKYNNLDKNYTFLLNRNLISLKYNKLTDLYAICKVNNMIVRISFDHIRNFQ
jgi:hypothetical protein